jgi:hypothetical protein
LFEVGEEAWLDAKNVNLKTKSDKLTERRLGPFRVIKKISDQAYRLELPETMRIHDVFYVGFSTKTRFARERSGVVRGSPQSSQALGAPQRY